MDKYELLPQQLLREGIAGQANFFSSDPLDMRSVYAVHEREYADRVVQGRLTRKEMRFTFSMHGTNNYPFWKEESDLDIGLEDKTGDGTYLRILSETLPALIADVKPDFIFYQAGVDILYTDKIGRMSCTLEGCRQRDEIVLQLAHNHNIPVQCSMGGGYSEQLRLIIEAHANTYRVAEKIF